MSCSAAQIYQPLFSKYENRMSVREHIFVNLRLDVNLFYAWIAVKFIYLYFIIKMSNITNNSLIFHFLHMPYGNNISIPRSRYIDICDTQSIFYSFHLITFHSSLKRADWVNLRNNYPCSKCPQGFSRALSYISIAANNRNFSSQHNICCSLDAVW